MKFWNWLKDEETGERVLRLDGAISQETWLGDEVTPAKFREELNSSEGDIVVWINSPGGDVFAAAEIYNMLKEYRGKVTVKIEALAGSAASWIAMSGDEVQISPVGQIFIHNPETEAFGNTDEFKLAIKELEQIKEGIILAYKLKTGLSRETISKLMDEATWLNAQKALELRFVDKIMFNELHSVPTSAQIFSQKKITNSLLSAVGSPPLSRRVAVARLRNRLNSIEEYNPKEWGKTCIEISKASGNMPVTVGASVIKFGLRRGKKYA